MTQTDDFPLLGKVQGVLGKVIDIIPTMIRLLLKVVSYIDVMLYVLCE